MEKQGPSFRWLRSIIGALLLLFIVLNANAQNEEQYSQTRIRVKLSPEKAASLQAVNQNGTSLKAQDVSLSAAFQKAAVQEFKRVFRPAGKFEAKHRKHGLHLWYELAIDNSVGVNRAMALLQTESGFNIVEPIYNKRKIGILTDPPNDPLLNEQWHYNNTGQTGGTVGADIKLFQAWGLETGDTSVIVAVTDGGIDINHEDLVPNLWVNHDEIPDNGIDDDNNGYIDDIHGYGFGDESPVIAPDFHGTHVGGTVAAVNNNGTGVAGVAGGSGTGTDGVKMMSLAAFGAFGTGNFEDTYTYAADNGAVISQNSWGYTAPGAFEQAVLDAMDYFIAEAGYDENGDPIGPMQGGIVIVAAGNDGTDEEWYPGFYEPTVAVAGTDHNDDQYVSSNRGDWVELAAPAVSVFSTFENDNYGLLTGTSMACPHVSGVAALIISRFQGNITPQQVKDRLILTTDPLPGLEFLGSGRLNAFNALQSDDGIPPNAIEDLSSSSVTLSSVSLSWTAPLDSGNGSASFYDLRYSESPIDETNFDSASAVPGVPGPQAAGTPESFEVTGLMPNTTYYFAIVSEDFFGNASEISNVVEATTDEAPVASVSTTSLESDILSGESEVQNLQLINSGNGPLDFSISFGGTTFTPQAAGASQLGNEQRTRVDFSSGKVGDINVKAFVPKNASVSPFGNSVQYETGFEEFSVGDLDGQNGWAVNNGVYYIDDNDPFAGSNHIGAISEELPLGETAALAFSPDIAIGTEDYSSFTAMVKVPETGVTWEIIPQSPTAGFVNTRIVFDPAGNILALDDFSGNFEDTGEDVPSGYFSVTLVVDKLALEFTLYIDNAEIYNGGAFAPDIEQIVLLTNSEVVGNSFLMDDLQVVDGLVDTFAFLSTDIDEGTVPANDTIDIAVTFNAEGFFGGLYESSVEIATNDPVNPEIIVAASMTVTGTEDPVIAVSPDTLVFPGTFAGDTSVLPLTIQNNGTEILTVSDITSDNGVFLVSDTAVTLFPFEETVVDVYFVPSDVDFYFGVISLISNDSDATPYEVVAVGEGIEPPLVRVEPESIEVEAEQGGNAQASLYLINDGAAELEFSIDIESAEDSGQVQNVQIDIPFVASTTSSNTKSNASSLRSSSGIHQQFSVELSSEVISILILSPDSDVSDIESTLDAFADIDASIFPASDLLSLTIDDLIPYDVVLTSNNTQWVAVDPGLPDLVGDVLADYIDEGGKAIINSYAIDWDAWSLGGRFIEEEYGAFIATTSDFVGTSELGTIHEPGHPIMQGVSTLTNGYLWQDPILADDATLLADWSDGNHFIAAKSSVVSLNLLPSDGNGNPGWTGDLPIIYHNAANWLQSGEVVSVNPTEGIVAGGDTVEIDVAFNAAILDPGTYFNDILINTNDPLNQQLVVSTSFTVTGPNISASPESIELSLEKGDSQSEVLTINNFGDQNAPYSVSLVVNNIPELSGVTTEGYTPYQKRTSANTTSTDLMGIQSYQLSEVQRLATDLYVTDFETFSLGDINGQQGWLGQFVNWVIDDANPASGDQHITSVSDGFGLTLALSPTVTLGVEDYVTFVANISVEGSGTTWQFIPQSSIDTLVATRFQVSPDGSIQMLVPDGGGGTEFIDVGQTVPDGYFQLAIQSEKASNEFKVFIDGSEVFTGEGFSGIPDGLALLSLMEITGSTFYMDDFKIIDGKFTPSVEYLTVTPEEGVIPAGGSVDLDVSFETLLIPFGTYQTDIVISVDSSNVSEVVVPTTLNVIGEPAILVEPTVLLENIDFQESRTKQIDIQNIGGSTLDFNIEILGAELNSTEPNFEIAPKKQFDNQKRSSQRIQDKYLIDQNSSRKDDYVAQLDVMMGETVFTEDFEGESFPPDGWQVIDNEGTGVVWAFAADYGEENYTGGEGEAATTSSDAVGTAEFDTELITPSINVAGRTNVVLQYKANYQNFGNRDFLDVDITTDGGSTWTNVLSWNEDHGGLFVPDGELVTLELDDYINGASEMYLRWRYYDPLTDDFDWYAQVDDIVVMSDATKWLSIAPASGSLEIGENALIDVTFDAANVDPGLHVAGLVVSSNAANAAQVGVVAAMDVNEPAVISVSEESLSEELVSGYTSEQFITIGNSGESNLKFNFIGFEGTSSIGVDLVGTSSDVRSNPFDGEVLDKLSLSSTINNRAFQWSEQIYATDFEVLEPGDINGQDGWFGQFGNWTVTDAMPYQGVQHFRGLSDGFGQSISASPFITVGDEEVTTYEMEMKLEGSGVSWWLQTESITDGLINFRLIVNPDGSLTIVAFDEFGSVIVEELESTLPEGYFNFKIQVNQVTGIFSLYVNDEALFEGFAVSLLAETFVIVSQMEVAGPTLDMDNFKVWDGEPVPDFLSVNPGSGIVGPGTELDITIGFDATTLPGGVYEEELLLSNNDPFNSAISIPVTLTVIDPPVISVSPASISDNLVQGDNSDHTLTITNEGVADLEFAFSPEGVILASESIAGENNFNLAERLLDDEFAKRYQEDLLNSSQNGVIPVLKLFDGVSLFEEEFEGEEFPPASWSVVDNAGTGMVWQTNEFWGDGNYCGEGLSAMANSDAFGRDDFDTELITPVISTEGLQGVMLQFSMNYQNFLNQDFVDVDISADGGEWINVLSFNEDYGGFFETPGEVFTAELDPYLSGATEFQLRWHYYDPTENEWDWYVQIDNVIVTGESTPWITVSPSAGTLGEGASVDINVNLNAAELDPGLYEQNLVINSNDLVTPVVEVPVSLEVIAPCVASGTILWEYWLNAAGNTIADIPMGTTPQGYSQLTEFKAPTNFSNQYAGKVSGFLCVPESGLYKFYIASDDESELWLSTDNDPANKVKIAYLYGYVKEDDYDDFPSQASADIYLESGRSYYIEAIHKEGSGKDHLSVAWKLPDGTMDAPISGSYLSPVPFEFLEAVTVPSPSSGVRYSYFEDDLLDLPEEFDAATLVNQDYSTDFDIESNKMREDRFAFEFQGYVSVPATDVYTFYTSSDDGSELYIGEKKVVDNGGLHGVQERQGIVALNAGLHPIIVRYFDRRYDDYLAVYWSSSSVAKEEIPSAALYNDTPLDLHPALSPTIDEQGIYFSYYENSWVSVPDFSEETILKEGVINNFSLSPRERSYDFGFYFAGYLKAPADGFYRMFTTSDDGSLLYIDDKLIVDNDGLHGARERSGVVGLEEGWHKIEVGYFDDSGLEVLNVSWKTPGGIKVAIPDSVLGYGPGLSPSSVTQLSQLDRFNASSADKQFDVFVYPNPIANYMNVETMISRDATVKFTLIDAMGKTHYLGERSVVEGPISEYINLQKLSLSSGVYMLHMDAEYGKIGVVQILVE